MMIVKVLKKGGSLAYLASLHLGLALLALLTVPRTLAAGAMLSDIPVCQAPHFQWARVKAATVSFNSRTLTVPGRMMTAQEKQALRQKTKVNRPPDGTNITAEAWFKNL